MTKANPNDAKYSGFICNFDITNALLNGDNTYKVYLYTSSVGTGSKLSFCKMPPNVGYKAAYKDPITNQTIPENPGTPSPADTCEYWDNFSEEVTDFKTTDKGFDLNILTIKRNTSDNTKIDVKVGAGSWVRFFFYEKIKIKVFYLIFIYLFIPIKIYLI